MKITATGWAFSRTGGVDQVVLKDGNDVDRLKDLDPKLWAVLALPANQPDLGECLEIMDADRDGKVRIPDILRSVEELKAKIVSLDLLFEPGDSLPIDRITDPAVKEAIAHILASLSQTNALGRIGLVDADKAIEVFSSLPFNGDGLLEPSSTQYGEVGGLIGKIIASGFSSADVQGKQGLDASSLASFACAAKARLAWLSAEPSHEAFPVPEEERAAAYSLFTGLVHRLDDYFQKCGVLAMSGSGEAGAELDKVLSSILAGRLDQAGGAGLEKLPIAMPRAACFLESSGAVNPFDADALAAFLGITSMAFGLDQNLGKPAWEGLKKAFGAYGSWVQARPSSSLAGFDRGALEAALGGSQLIAIGVLIERDMAMAVKAEGLKSLRRLLVMKRDFLAVLRNFVNLDDFYSRGKGLFRAGRLFLDGRELEFCLEVKNPANHAAMVGLSSIYLIYCSLTKHSGEQKSIVAALTAGDADNIFLGRNGVFYDRDGED